MKLDYRDLLQRYCDKLGFSSLKISTELEKREFIFTEKEIHSWIWKKEIHYGELYNDVLDIIGAKSILIHSTGYVKNGVIYNFDGSPLRVQHKLKSADPKDVREYLEKKGYSVQARIDFYLELAEDVSLSGSQRQKAMDAVNILAGDIQTKKSVNENVKGGKSGKSSDSKKGKGGRKRTILTGSYAELDKAFPT